MLGIVVMGLGRYLAVGYLDPWDRCAWMLSWLIMCA